MHLSPAIRLAILAPLALAACDKAEPDPAARADALAHKFLIVDGHIDVPYRMEEKIEDVTQATAGGDFDWPRAIAGGLDAPFMSIYTPAGLEFDGDPTSAARHAEKMIGHVEAIVARAPDKFAIATSPDEVLAAKAAGRIALPLGMENGAPIAGDLANLDHFFERGIRYITLTHARSGHIADSSYDEARPNDGLSDFGVEVVRRMNALGIMVDISHVSDAAFYDVLGVTTAPPIASHSSARHFTPGFERNMSDEMIRALGEAGGVIMINFGSAFLTAQANAWNSAQDDAYEAWLAGSGTKASDAQKEAFEERYRADHPYPYATLGDVLDHIDHVVALAGIDAVGLGSDYDGVGDSLPRGLEDVSAYPNLVRGLLERNYSEIDIEKILGGNLIRVWRTVEAVAAAD